MRGCYITLFIQFNLLITHLFGCVKRRDENNLTLKFVFKIGAVEREWKRRREKRREREKGESSSSGDGEEKGGGAYVVHPYVGGMTTD